MRGCKICGRKHSTLLHLDSHSSGYNEHNWERNTHGKDRIHPQGQHSSHSSGHNEHNWERNTQGKDRTHPHGQNSVQLQGSQPLIPWTPNQTQGIHSQGQFTHSRTLEPNKQGQVTHIQAHEVHLQGQNTNFKGQHDLGDGVPYSVYLGQVKTKDYSTIEDRVQVSKCNHTNSIHTKTEILLSTALVYMQDNFGNFHECRALLDCGSQSNFIQGITKITRAMKGIIQSKTCSYKVSAFMLVIDKISDNLPAFNLNLEIIDIPKNIMLADSSFGVSKPVELLLGSSIFWQLLCVGQIRLGKDKPILQKTKLGWVVSGPVRTIDKGVHFSGMVSCDFSALSLNEQMEQFWKIEELDIHKKSLSVEDKYCQELFNSTTTKDLHGRYIVQLPLREDITKLGDSYSTAMKRFQNLEKKLSNNLSLREQYHKFMEEYLALGHMTKIDDWELQIQGDIPKYYIPHHGILKTSSTTTKLRVVFDGSAKTDNNLSLNDVLMVGPRLQEDLLHILLRFRKHKVVVASDIEKMYRQVLISSKQRDLQRIFWRFSSDQPISTYKLNTITYGLAPSAFLAIRCIQQAAYKHMSNLHEACQTILRDFYADDLLSGGDTIEEVRKLKQDISFILSSAGFQLRKWVSNKPEVFEGDLQNNQQVEHYLSEDITSKTLGLYWNTQLDILQYNINFNIQSQTTKRSVLSMISQIFDPLGLVGPVIITAKVIMQSLWKLKLDWNESLPQDLHTAWNKFKETISDLHQTQIPRHVLCLQPKDIELHCFSDASEIAYGVAIYVRSISHDGLYHVHLLCAKSRVAPLKTISLPRLELCGALLSAKLAREVIHTMDIRFNKVHFWTDSTITLHWIKGEASKWKTFVSHRVLEIQNLTKTYEWHHIHSKENPADIISRGMEPKLLKDSSLWWNGPKWLMEDKEKWPYFNINDLSTLEVPDKRPVKFSLIVTTLYTIWDRFSSLNKLQKTTAYILRFINNCRLPIGERKWGILTVDEREGALRIQIKMAQLETFGSDILSIKRLGSLCKTSSLISLNPFLDSEGILRVGGRLQNSDLPFSQKHPIILPKNHVLTRLIVTSYHLKHLHMKQQTLLSILRLKFWILSGRNTIRHILHKCITCFRARPVTINNLMGQLPRSRVVASRPFLNCGIDYGGPFQLKTSNLRNCKIVKSYICIFTCFTTRATHIELVYELTTESFLNCFKRFVARRGHCQNLYSDNATSFVGANNHLKELYSFISDTNIKSKFLQHFADHQINWKFIPPHSPHFGGVWESTIKSVKYHLKRVLGENKYTYDEMYTLLTQVESCLNSRPLLPLSNDPLDLGVLTPGHFLIGDSLMAVPQEDLTDVHTNKLKRYHHLTQVIQHFWARWSREYLSSLQQRTKWKAASPNIQRGSMVILKDDKLPPMKWELGRVVDVYPSAMG
ncbi:uncharacterized protein [Diabrotica undecimpunctata]|uniref:uncharacterized protein n=1 Tax=Diabrotica undecimpunctata TaxID=50387 RepID=UPI003B63B272